MKRKINNKLLVFFYLSITVIFILSLMREPKEISELENRNLYKLSEFSTSDYLKKLFQDNTEKAVSDQILGSGTIRKYLQNKLNFSQKLVNNKYICRENYLKIGTGEGKDYYNYNCEKVLVYGNVKDKDSYKKTVQKILDSYKQIEKQYDTYFYYIPTSYTFNFRENKEIISVLDIIDKNWKVDYLKYKDYNEYKNLFFHTDHHWNYKGSYQGYKDIHKLLNIKEEIIKPEEEIKFPIEFYGSASKVLQLDNYSEPFIVYKYKLPKHSSYVPTYKIKYGNKEDYFKGIYKNEIYTNHYGEYYGVDYDEVIMNYKKRKKENLLIISNSFSNSINELIASHFNKTFIIDTRHYKNFNVHDYIKKNKISKILFIMDSGGYFKDDSYYLKGEE